MLGMVAIENLMSEIGAGSCQRLGIAGRNRLGQLDELEGQAFMADEELQERKDFMLVADFIQ